MPRIAQLVPANDYDRCSKDSDDEGSKAALMDPPPGSEVVLQQHRRLFCHSHGRRVSYLQRVQRQVC